MPNSEDAAAAFAAVGGSVDMSCSAPDAVQITVADVELTSPSGTGCPGFSIEIERTFTITDTDPTTGECKTTTCVIIYTIESTQGPVITAILPEAIIECAGDANPLWTDIMYTTDCDFDLGEAGVNITGPGSPIGMADCPSTHYRFTYTVTDGWRAYQFASHP